MDFDFCIFEMHASYKIYDHLDGMHTLSIPDCCVTIIFGPHVYQPTPHPVIIKLSKAWDIHWTEGIGDLSTHIGQIIYSIGNDRSKWPDWHLSQTHYSGGFKFQNQVMNSNIRQSMTCCSRSAPSSCTPFRISVQHTRWGLQCFV